MLTNLAVLGLNHVTATRDLREHLAFQQDNFNEGLAQLNQIAGMQGGFILSTCNRLELYFYGDADANRIIEWLASFRHVQVAEVKSCYYYYEGRAALRHLIRVAAGLDSMLLGESQVFGQVKESYRLAKELGYIQKPFDSLMQFVFATVKNTRSNTKIGTAAVTLASVGVKLAAQVLDGLRQKQALVIGAGSNARLVIQHLRAVQIDNLYIANRTYHKSEALAKEYQGKALSLMDIGRYLPRVNCIFTSTSSPTILVGKGMVEEAVRNLGHMPLFICDMSVPHDVERSIRDLNQVFLYDLVDIENAIKNNYSIKEGELTKAEGLINQEISNYIKEHALADDLLKIYRAEVATLKHNELARFLSDDMDEQTKELCSRLADSLTAKISHGPTKMIRDMQLKEDNKSINYVRRNLLRKSP